jgi:hypothetical protein
LYAEKKFIKYGFLRAGGGGEQIYALSFKNRILRFYNPYPETIFKLNKK